MYKKYKVVLSNRGECHQQRGQTVTRKCSPLKDRCYLQCTITVRTAKDCLHLSIANVGIILTLYSHTLVGLTSSLKTRACSSQPIRFWTNLKTCSTNRHTEFLNNSNHPEKENKNNIYWSAVMFTSSTFHAATWLAWMPWTPGSSLQCCSQHRDRVLSDWLLRADMNSDGYTPSDDMSDDKHTETCLDSTIVDFWSLWQIFQTETTFV